MRALLRVLARLDGARAERLVAEVREAAAAAPSVEQIAVERLAEGELPTRLVLVQFLGLLAAEPAAVPILLAGRDEALAEVAPARSSSSARRPSLDRGAWGVLDGRARRGLPLFGRRAASAARPAVEALDERDPELRAAAVRGSARAGCGRAAAAGAPARAVASRGRRGGRGRAPS